MKIKNRNKMSNVPNLRFPEFEGEWEIHKLSDIADIVGGGTPDTTKEEYWNGEIQWFTPTEIKVNYVSKSQRTISKLGLANSSAKLLPKGTILLTTRATIGDTAIALEECTTNQGFQSFIIKNDNSNIFIFNWLKTIKDELIKKANGSTFLEVSKSEIENISISIPTIPEQNKISEFLSSIDLRIETQSQIVGELETLIKGLKETLFTQCLRFKNNDGKSFPSWKRKKLGEIGDFQTSSIDKLSKENEKEVYLVNYMNIYRHENINSDTIKSFQIVTAKDTQIESCNLRKGDILFTPSSETPADIGHSVVIFEDLNNAVFSYHLMRFRPKIELNTLYSHYFCNIPSVLNQLSKLATGSTRFTISVKSFSSISILLPSFSEQIKIAALLSSVDKKLETEKQILKRYIEQKKYLLANMFV